MRSQSKSTLNNNALYFYFPSYRSLSSHRVAFIFIPDQKPHLFGGLLCIMVFVRLDCSECGEESWNDCVALEAHTVSQSNKWFSSVFIQLPIVIDSLKCGAGVVQMCDRRLHRSKRISVKMFFYLQPPPRKQHSQRLECLYKTGWKYSSSWSNNWTLPLWQWSSSF